MEEGDILDIGDLGVEEGTGAQSAKVDENPEKQKYINDNIIAKGYNLDDLSRSITIRTGLTINEISLDTLKKEIEFYKTQQLKESYKASKEVKAIKVKKEEIVSDLYAPEHLQLKTAIQLSNPLIKLEEEKKIITPSITDSRQEKSGGLLGKKTIYYFTIKCPEINTEVVRTLDDFEFFQNVLIERYPFKYIPPIFPKNKDKVYSHELFKRYLNRFLESITHKKILRTSPITYEFLELNTNDFAAYRKNLTEKKFVCRYNMENYTTMKGMLNVEFNHEQINQPDKMYKKIEATQSIYNNLNHAMGKIINDLNNLGRHMLEASNAFSALSNYSRESEQSPLLVTCYEKLKDIFSQWSASYDKQKFFLDHNFREFFDYMNLQVKALGDLQKQYTRIKTDYEKYGVELLQKKEKLFNNKKVNLWELSEEDNKNVEFLKQNKESAFKAMLPGMSNLVSAQKVQMACSCNIVKKEFEKFIKRQGENLKAYLLSLKDKNQNIISDAYILCSLFNIEL
jgi:hypothetical protein